MINKKLEEFETWIKSKNVSIIGLGVSNLPLVDYLHEKKAKVTVFDNRDIIEIPKDSTIKLEEYGFKYIGGKDNLKELKGFDIIFRSPSCIPTTKELEEEAKRGAIVTTEIEMLIKLAPCKIIGITGTEGKTTTSSIIYEILKEAKLDCYLGGNIGNPIFTNLKNINENSIIVLEMSSFQLMGMNISPNISLITNIYPDHLNVHKNMEEYVEAKKEIFKSQNLNDIIVLNYDNEITRKFASEAKGKVIFFSSKQKLKNCYYFDNENGNIIYNENGIENVIINKSQTKLRGVHNYENICAALAVTSSIVNTETQVKAIQKFRGVEHRLEFVREINGVKFYNDSIGTSPASTIAGLNAFDENIILLAGGSDKGLDYKEIGEKIAEKVGTLILCGPTSDKIEKAVCDAIEKTKNIEKRSKIKIFKVNNMKEAVDKAFKNAKEGDVVLLSPASASFDLYKNFAERGEVYKKIVKNIDTNGV